MSLPRLLRECRRPCPCHRNLRQARMVGFAALYPPYLLPLFYPRSSASVCGSCFVSLGVLAAWRSWREYLGHSRFTGQRRSEFGCAFQGGGGAVDGEVLGFLVGVGVGGDVV